MDHDILILALDHPDWTLPWAGIGAVLLGLGGTLSGIAAIITARNKGRDEARGQDETANLLVVSRADDGGSSGVSGSDSIQPGGGPS